LPIPITLAIGFYNSLHYRASRDVRERIELHCVLCFDGHVPGWFQQSDGDMRLAAAAAQYIDGDAVPAAAGSARPTGRASRTVGDLVTTTFVWDDGNDILPAGASGGDEGRVERARMSLILCGVVELNGNSCRPTTDLTVSSRSREGDGGD